MNWIYNDKQRKFISKTEMNTYFIVKVGNKTYLDIARKVYRNGKLSYGNYRYNVRDIEEAMNIAEMLEQGDTHTSR